MAATVLLVRYGEIHLKGANRPFFESLLVKAMRRAVEPFSGKVSRGDGRYYVCLLYTSRCV